MNCREEDDDKKEEDKDEKKKDCPESASSIEITIRFT